MLDELINIIKAQGQESVINNAEVPNEHNDGVIQAAGSSIIDTIKGMLANGQHDEVANIANEPNGAAAQAMQGGFIDKIMNQFGISGTAAKSIAASLIPSVIAQFQNKSAGASGAGGFDLASITGLLAKTGFDKDGDLDLKDLGKMLGF